MPENESHQELHDMRVLRRAEKRAPAKIEMKNAIDIKPRRNISYCTTL